MMMDRLLLPFTHGVDTQAIDSAVLLAKSHGAILVPLSLICLSGTRGARLEHIQQSKDFLEVVRHKAGRLGVPVEPVELSTRNAVQSTGLFAREMACAGILLFLREGAGVLLDTDEVKQVLQHESVSLYLVCLQAKEGMGSRLRRLSRWFQRQQGHLLRIQSCSTGEVVRQCDVQTHMLE
jgi:hypothetical protein